MVQAEAYFDASATHRGSPALCVAGYVMDKDGAKALTADWVGALNWSDLPKPLPYFRMSDCAHGNGVCRDLTERQCLKLEMAMLRFIKTHTVMGFAVTINEEE